VQMGAHHQGNVIELRGQNIESNINSIYSCEEAIQYCIWLLWQSCISLHRSRTSTKEK
jgi:hypothetical protein